MVEDSVFTFQGAGASRFTVSIGAARVRVAYVSTSEHGSFRHEKSWDVALADIVSATVCDWRVRGVGGEAIYLHCKRGGTPMFMTSSVWLTEGRVSGGDRDTYLAATAALFKALAATHPQMRIRKGRPPGWKTRWTVYLACGASLLSGLFLWETGGFVFADDSRRLIVVASIFAMATLFGIYRVRLLQQPSHAGVSDVAAWMVKRAPVVGPWGAAATAL